MFNFLLIDFSFVRLSLINTKLNYLIVLYLYDNKFSFYLNYLFYFLFIKLFMLIWKIYY